MNWTVEDVVKSGVALAAIGGLVNSGLNTKFIRDSETFNQTISRHSEAASSFKDQINSATDRGDVGEADRIRINYEDFEESWRKGESILDMVSALIFTSPLEFDVETQRSVDSWLAEIESHPEWGLRYPPIDHGNVLFFAGRYYQAANEYQVALNSNPGDYAVGLSRIRALYYAASVADTDQQRAIFGRQASDTYSMLRAGQTMRLPLIIDSNPAFQQYIEELRIRIGQQDD